MDLGDCIEIVWRLVGERTDPVGATTMRYRFDQFELDTEQFSLRANSASIHVEPMVFDLLCFLVENAGQVLTREAIIERVWKGRFVSEATVSSCIKSARKALGDSGQNQTYIRTLRGRGF